MVYLFTRTHGRVQKDTFAQPRTLHLCNCAYGPQLVNTPTMGVAPDAYISSVHAKSAKLFAMAHRRCRRRALVL